ncbi:MAG: chorismate mutase [Lachnospiraceae bacterium]|nr:bifunctional chorismate mutase/prephenate dehydratase [Lachnospiraceae bacterium]MDE6761903.1 chorismate mutase [Lachnospiraceae bacterium]
MVQDLNKIREEIDAVDKEIVKLIEQRMDLALEVAKYKKSTGKPIYDRERELQKLEKLGLMASTEFNAKSIQELFLQIMSVSRRYQYSVIGDQDHVIDAMFSEIGRLKVTQDTKVVYAGVPGAFAETAMVAYFGEGMQGDHVKEFLDVAKQVAEGKASYGVLPIENSSAGFVNGIYDLLERFSLSIVGEQMIQINQCLLGIPGTDLSKVKMVYSHPQGFLQSKEYLENKNWKQVSMANTAESAKKVCDEGDMTQVAIASERAAKIYGLSVLNPQLNVADNNTTRFVIVSNKKEYVKDADKVSISFSLPHTCGTLYNILAHFIFNDINMTSIESVPLSGKQWEYCFFVDFEGNLGDNRVKNALKGIMAETENFRILGCFVSDK